MTNPLLLHSSNYRQLDSQEILTTALRLAGRINNRFPESGLGKLSQELCDIIQESCDVIQWIRKPQPLIRYSVFVLIGLLGMLLIMAAVYFIIQHKVGEINNALEFVEILEPGLGCIFFLSAIIAFLISLEQRVKRNRALDAIHELRSIAHIIDMHQLSKDPRHRVSKNPEEDEHCMNNDDLIHYLDYCSELLSVISKIAALYVQNFQDSVAITAVDEVENLATGLSRKIWQKIMFISSSEHDIREFQNA